MDFTAAKRELSWLDRAWEAVAVDSKSFFAEAGWDRFYAGLERYLACEASARRNGAVGCVTGANCPDTSPVRCEHCVGLLEQEVAA